MAQSRPRDFSDVEKRRISTDNDHEFESEDEDPESATTSRSVSSLHAPMLNRAYSHKDRTGPILRLRPSVMRYACLGVAGILLLFMLSLVRFSQLSQKEVQQAIIQDKQSPKPPVWEEFPFLERYYGGVRALVSRQSNQPEYPRDGDEVPVRIEPAQPDPEIETPETPRTDEKPAARPALEGRAAVPDSVVFDPYPNYKSAEYIAEYGEKVDCFLDDANNVQIPRVRIYEAVPQGFPDNVMGSAELVGMRNDICYDRFGRLGPYGLGYSLNKGGSGAQQAGEREGADLVWQDHPEVDFRKVKWADVQQRCNAANAHRFKEQPPAPTQSLGARLKRADDDDTAPADNAHATVPAIKPKAGRSKIPRTAVVVRTWWDYQYTPEDMMYLRSLISELNVLSGGKYTVHFLIHVKDDNARIWSDDKVYEQVLHDSLPEEFRGMGTLWTERQMFLIYGGLEESWMRGLPVHGVYRSTFMPMQYFAYQHPEYDFFWHWEMDVRSTNHWYHFFESVSNWARKQPRKYLWERNARFYVPAEHGTWEDFSHMVRIQTEQGTNSANNVWSGLRAGGREPGSSDQRMSGDRAIWGPERPLDDDVRTPTDPEPPTTFDKDKYTWGVDEDADLISFNPFFDPDGTSWLLADDTTGYNITRGRPPRRTAIITASRLSRKLLMNMHWELSQNKHTMFSEMWPASCALHHGLKAVYAPHPVYIDRRWPTSYLEKTFNGGRNGASGGARTSVFGDREHNFRGTTWYYNAGFPEVLWHRWLGMKIHNAGGEIAETEGEGRMCLPGMLLHPIKRVDLVQEGKKAD